MSHNYRKGPCIGKGSFGKVYRGVEIETNQVVALKLQDLESAADEIDVIRREIQVMSEISSPHVVRYHTSFIEATTLWLVMEYMAGGSLKDMVDEVGPFNEDAIAEVMKALCRGLEYIHRERKLHRDIKAANILLTADGDVKLADFGVAGQMTNTLRQRNTYVGSPFWMAPEVIQRSQYDHTADIWSVGITAIELARGRPPYHDEHVITALGHIANSEPPRLDSGTFSRHFCDFVAGCLRRQPRDRMTAAELLKHPFLEKAHPAKLKELLRRKQGMVALRTCDSVGAASADVASDAAATTDALRNGSWDFGTGTDSAPGTVRVRQEVDFDSPVPADDTGTVIERAPKGPPSKESNSRSWGKSSKQATSSSDLLADLCLPVLATLRANAAEGGSTTDQKLASALGALEVAFVHMELAKSGACELFFRELLAEASTSTSREIRDMVAASIPSKFVKSRSSKR